METRATRPVTDTTEAPQTCSGRKQTEVIRLIRGSSTEARVTFLAATYSILKKLTHFQYDTYE